MTLKKIQGQDTHKEINKIDRELLEEIKPKNFAGANGVEVRMIKNFEDACIAMIHHKIASNPKELSVLAFFRGLDAIKEMTKKR